MTTRETGSKEKSVKSKQKSVKKIRDDVRALSDFTLPEWLR